MSQNTDSEDIGAQYLKLLQEKGKKQLNREEMKNFLGPNDSSTQEVQSHYRITPLENNKINVEVIKGDPIQHFSDVQIKEMDDYADACCGTDLETSSK
jgi:hypothetical protein